MRSLRTVFIIATPLLMLGACSSFTDQDRAELSAASQNAEQAKQQATQANATAQQALQASQAAQASANSANEKADRMFQHSLRK